MLQNIAQKFRKFRCWRVLYENFEKLDAGEYYMKISSQFDYHADQIT